MSIIIDGTGTISGVSATGLSSPQSGSVLQVVNATYGTVASNSSTTYADTGLTATITPKFATSKILILVSQQGVITGSTANGVGLAILRNYPTPTNICQFAILQSYFSGSTTTGLITGASANFLDSPATTTAVIYKTQFNSFNGTNIVSVQNNGDKSTITLMEIAG